MGTSYEDLIARNLRAARAIADLPQSTLSARMRRLGYTSWDDSKVSRAERGKVPVTAGELLALSAALECSVAELVGSNTPPDLTVTFPAGYELAGVTVRNSALGYRDGSIGWPEGSDHPVISRPANVLSTMAHDKSRFILEAGPLRLVRAAPLSGSGTLSAG